MGDVNAEQQAIHNYIVNRVEGGILHTTKTIAINFVYPEKIKAIRKVVDKSFVFPVLRSFFYLLVRKNAAILKSKLVCTCRCEMFIMQYWTTLLHPFSRSEIPLFLTNNFTMSLLYTK